MNYNNTQRDSRVQPQQRQSRPKHKQTNKTMATGPGRSSCSSSEPHTGSGGGDRGGGERGGGGGGGRGRTSNRVCSFRESRHIPASHRGRCTVFSEVTDCHDTPNAASCSIVRQSCFLCGVKGAQPKAAALHCSHASANFLLVLFSRHHFSRFLFLSSAIMHAAVRREPPQGATAWR